MAAPDPAYPRPQLVRERWTDLCGTWQFAYDDADTGLDERWYEEDASGPSGPFDREIVVPYPPESPASGIGETGFHPVVWYRRTFERPDRASASCCTSARSTTRRRSGSTAPSSPRTRAATPRSRPMSRTP